MSKRIKTKLGFEGSYETVTISIPDGDPPPWGPTDKLRVVSTDVARLDGVAKVTGGAKYTADVKRPGMLHGRVLRSPHAAARIVSLDLEPALAVDGVKAAVKLDVDVVRYVGQPIAAVAATTRALADQALERIAVRYETGRFVVDTVAAMRPDAPAVYPKRKRVEGHSANVRRHEPRTKGSIARGLKRSEVTEQRTFRTRVQTHCCLEPHGVVAEWKGDRLTVWASTQGVFGVREELASALSLSPSKVTVITDHMGGGFGSKFGPGPYGVMAARLAREAGAAVRMMLDRREEQLATGNRPDSIQKLRLGARRSGELSAMDLLVYGSAGVGSGAGTGNPLLELYRCADRIVRENDVFTNAGPSRPFRAPGHPQGCFALEQMIDVVAERLKVDPLQFRLDIDPHPVRRRQMQLGAERIGWSRRNRTAGSGTGPRKRGIGMASGLWYNTGRPAASALVKVHEDGSIEVFSGAQDIGTGLRTVVGVVAAEELGVSPDQLTVHVGHTDYPYGPGSGGSKTTPTVAPAVRRAAYHARLQLLAAARKMLGLGPGVALELRGGRIARHDGKGRSLTLREVMRTIPGNTLSVLQSRAPNYRGYRDTVAGVQLAEVEVDIETGVIRVIKVVAVHDCGRPIDRLTVRSQINGGVIQGISYALFEERVLDRQTGQMVNANLEQYKIAGALDVPEIDAVLFDVSFGSNNTGAVGIGEPTTVPTSAALANAVYNAIGRRLYELPMTPPRVLAALARKDDGRGWPAAPWNRGRAAEKKRAQR